MILSFRLTYNKIQIIQMITKIILLMVSLFFVSQQKIFSKRYTLNEIRRQKGWLFLDRMSFNKGHGSVKINIKIQTPTEGQREVIPLQLVAIPQNIWLQQQQTKCTKLKQIGDQIILQVQIRKHDNYQASAIQQMTIFQHTDYHFVLRDCGKILANQYFRKQTKVNIILEMKNGEYTHGADQHINKIMLPFLIILTGIMGYFIKGTKHNEIGQEKDWAKFLLFITLEINLVALVFNYIGFIMYLTFEQYYGFFDVMYLLFHSVSESLLTSILLFIAYGWTITFTKDAEFDIYIPLAAMLGLINLILTILGKINDGDADKYHMYDTIPSYVLIFFRITTIIVFAVGIVKVYLAQKKNGPLVSFLANFAFMGSIYFLSLPAIMLIASMLPVSLRKQIVFFSVEFFKNIVNLVLTWMVSSKKSKYKSIKQSDQSFFQTGNKLL